MFIHNHIAYMCSLIPLNPDMGLHIQILKEKRDLT